MVEITSFSSFTHNLQFISSEIYNTIDFPSKVWDNYNMTKSQLLQLKPHGGQLTCDTSN